MGIVKFGQDLEDFSGFSGFPAVSFPKDTVGVALDVLVCGREIEPFLGEAAVGFVDFDAQIVPIELFGDDGCGAGAVEGVEHEIALT